MNAKKAKEEFARLHENKELVSQLELPKLQAMLREISASETPIETLEHYLASYPEFDAFLSKCLRTVRPDAPDA